MTLLLEKEPKVHHTQLPWGWWSLFREDRRMGVLWRDAPICKCPSISFSCVASRAVPGLRGQKAYRLGLVSDGPLPAPGLWLL